MFALHIRSLIPSHAPLRKPMALVRRDMYIWTVAASFVDAGLFPRGLPARPPPTNSSFSRSRAFFPSPTSQQGIYVPLLLSSALRSNNGLEAAEVTGSHPSAPALLSAGFPTATGSPSSRSARSFRSVLFHVCAASIVPSPCVRPSCVPSLQTPQWQPTAFRCTATFAPRSQTSAMSRICSRILPVRVTCPTITRSKFVRHMKRHPAG